MADQPQSVSVKNNGPTDQARQDRQNYILETITDGFFTLDDQYCILDASSGAQKNFFRRPLEQLKGKDFFQEFPQFARSQFESRVRVAVSTRKQDHFEAHLTKGGVWYEVYLFPDEGRTDIYLKNISHRKRFELNAFRQETTLKAIFDADPSGLAVVAGQDFRLAYVNQAFLDLLPDLGVDPIGKPVMDFAPAEIRQFLNVEQLVAELNENQKLSISQLSFRTPEGTDRYFSVHLRSLPWEEQPAVLIVIWEITEREQINAQLQHKNQMLALLKDAAAELLAGANPREHLDAFFQRASKVLGLEVYVQYDLAPDGSHLDLAKITGFPERYLKVLQSLELGQAVCGTVAKTRKPMAVNHVQQKKDRTTRLIRKLGIDTYACHPLMVEDRLIGTLSFGSRTLSEFDPETISILKAFCDLVAVAIDRKNTEEALRLNEERLRGIMENSLDVAYRRNLQTDRYDYMSPVSEQVLGYAPEEMDQLPFEVVLDLIHPEDRAGVESGMLRALETGKARISYRFKRKDGEYRWVADHVTIQRDAQGKPLYRNGILRDIHERRQAEEALQLSEERFRLAAQAMNEGLWELDFQTRQSWWNETYDKLFGPRPFEEEPAEYDWWLEHVHPNDRENAREKFWQAVEGDTERWECEYRFRRPDGELVYVLDRAVIARDAEGKATRITGAMLDLTSLKNAEVEREQLVHELETERSLWKATISSMVDAVTICDADGQAYYMNDAYSHLIDRIIQPALPLEDHPQHYKIYHPDGTLFDPTELPLQKAALTGEAQRGVELIQKSAHGEDILLTWNAAPIRDEQGEVIGAVAVGRDITVQRRIEKALRESEEKFRLIADIMPSLVWTAEADGRLDYVNKLGLDILGDVKHRTAQEAIVGSLAEQERLQSALAWQRGFEQGETFEMEFRLKLPNGEQRWFLSRCIPVYNNLGAIIKWYGVATDIHVLKQAQEELERRVQARTKELRVANAELRQSAGRSLVLSEISRQMSEAGVDYQRVIDAVVKTTSRLIGDACILRLLSEDGQWLNPVAYYHQDPGALPILADALKTNTYHPDEGIQGEVFRSGKGKIFSVNHPDEWLALVEAESAPYMRNYGASSTLIVPLRMKDKVVGTLGVFHGQPGKIYTQEDQILLQELADRAALAIFNSMLYRDLEKSLLQEKLMRQQLIQSEKYAALARLVASVAHELNNPIQTIQNCVYLVRDEVPGSPAQDFLNMAIDETRRIARLTEQLRETYRPAKDTSFTSVNVIDVVKSVRSLLEPHLQHHQVTWEMLPSPASVMVQGIPDQLKQVFINISMNAIDAIGDQGGRLEIGVTLYPGKKRVCVSFRDSGPGIPPENLGKLFEPFFTTKPKGTGLGLAITREIVEGHGGEITVDSKVEEGAVFRVWLPMVDGSQ